MGYVEREAYAASVLVARMEDQALDSAPIWDDIKTFDGKPWSGRVDIIAAGYPCQPFSLAGKGLAEKDPSNLWPDVARIIEDVGSEIVVLENVRGHVNRGLRGVLKDLHGLGFDAEWGVYSAAQAGAPHRRNRLFILAYRQELGNTNSVRCQGERGYRVQHQKRKTLGHHIDGCGNEVGCPMPGMGDLIEEATDELPVWPPRSEDDWEDTPEEFRPAVKPVVRGMADGIRASWLDRLRALGNAVCPQQAELAIRDLLIRRTYQRGQ